MTCLDDEIVLGLIEGRLDPRALAGVDEHLDTCASCRDVVTYSAHARAQHLDRGHTLGRYVVGDLLGAGAMGRVYSAWEPELDRRVAIKILQNDAPGARERLLREAQAMARLDHPNVVGVHEVGRSEHGVYVAMDLVDGETLRTWAERENSWRQIARVLADVARGLAAVHAAGVLHRDVKPDNVIVGTDGRARIGDFGLARSTPTPPPDGNAPVATGTSVAGTPAYMAPEVLRGGSATAASDQFGFGVTAYEMIAGRRPFEGRTWSELARAIEQGSIAKLRVPGWLDATIRRCLAVDPAKRFPSMTAVADALQPPRRRAPWIAAAAGVALLASTATWLALRTDDAGPSCNLGASEIAAIANKPLTVDAPARAAIDRWAASWSTARDTVCRAATHEPAAVIATRERCLDRRRSELAALLDRVGTYGATPERLADALAALSPADCASLPLGAADPVPLDPQKAAIVRVVESELPAVRAAIALGDARPIAQQLTTLVERARASGHAPTLAEVLILYAEAARSLSNLPEAALAARDAAAAAERGHDDLAAARAWVERTTIAGDRRDLTAADDLAAIAAAAIDRAGAPRQLVAKLLRIRGLVAFNRGKLDEARKLLREARTLFAEIAGERSVEVSGVESSLGTVERAAGDFDAAERHHQLALDIDRQLRGDKHPDLARDLHNLAGVARSREQLARALELYHQALAIEHVTRGVKSVQAGLTNNSIGLVHMARGDWERARVELMHARNIFAAAGHGDLAFAEHNLGLVYSALGNPTEALRYFDAALAAYAATIGIDTAHGPIRLHIDRAHARLAARNVAGARSDALRARELAQRNNILWVVEEADAVLAQMPTRRTPVAIEPPPRVEPTPTVTVDPLPQQPNVDLPEPPKPPRKDVGVYGSSQGW